MNICVIIRLVNLLNGVMILIKRNYVAYASTWDASIYDLVLENIPEYVTHVNLSFVKPDTKYKRASFKFEENVTGLEFVEGATTNDRQHTFSRQQIRDLILKIALLRHRGTEVWISVGGWAYSQHKEWKNFNPKSIADLAMDLGATGIDIDWEPTDSVCNKGTAAFFSCTKDAEIISIITKLHEEITSRGLSLGMSIAAWSTGAYYVHGTDFEEGKVISGSPYGGTLYRLVKNHGEKLDFINIMAYDGGRNYDPREGYESYRAIYDGPINLGLQIGPEGAGNAVLGLHAPDSTKYDADMLDGKIENKSAYYNVETLVNYVKYKGKARDGFMLWQLWKHRFHAPVENAATASSASQYICEHLPLLGDHKQGIPTLPRLDK